MAADESEELLVLSSQAAASADLAEDETNDLADACDVQSCGEGETENPLLQTRMTIHTCLHTPLLLPFYCSPHDIRWTLMRSSPGSQLKAHMQYCISKLTGTHCYASLGSHSLRGCLTGQCWSCSPSAIYVRISQATHDVWHQVMLSTLQAWTGQTARWSIYWLTGPSHHAGTHRSLLLSLSLPGHS